MFDCMASELSGITGKAMSIVNWWKNKEIVKFKRNTNISF